MNDPERPELNPLVDQAMDGWQRSLKRERKVYVIAFMLVILALLLGFRVGFGMGKASVKSVPVEKGER